MNWKHSEGLGDGVITGCNQAHQWMLPWWWLNYSLHNNYPVLFLDFGMTSKGRKWCERRGTVMKVPPPSIAKKNQVPADLVEIWSKRVRKGVWDLRRVWFQKPFGLVQTPYARSIWIDIDCEIRAPLGSLFPLCENQGGIAVRKELTERQNYLTAIKAQLPGEKNYNSGVVIFKHGAPLITLWREKSEKENHLFMGDQDVLSRLLFEETLPFKTLPPPCHWLHYDLKNLRESPEEVMIYHYIGALGKKEILKKMRFIHNQTFISLVLENEI